MKLNLSVDEVLSTTRAVRKRMDFDKPVERSVVEECLQIAIQRQLFMLPPLGACMAISRHSSTTARSTGLSKSRRLRTMRVVVRSLSGVSSVTGFPPGASLSGGAAA